MAPHGTLLGVVAGCLALASGRAEALPPPRKASEAVECGVRGTLARDDDARGGALAAAAFLLPSRSAAVDRRLRRRRRGIVSPDFPFAAAAASEIGRGEDGEDEAAGGFYTAAAAAGGGAEDEAAEGVTAVAGRAAEIASVALLDVAVPVLSSAARFALDRRSSSSSAEEGARRPPTWDEFWSSPSPSSSDVGVGPTATTTTITTTTTTNAALVASALERLGPTYVKFGQALASRPDVVPPSLAAALSKLQDRMEPFDTEEARRIIREELRDRVVASGVGDGRKGEGEEGGGIGGGEEDGGFRPDEAALDALLDGLSPEPVAAASIGQVYRGHLPGYGDVAVKVQRPGIRETVQRDFALLRRGAAVVESLPALPVVQDADVQTRLVSTELVAAVDEFMSRIFEELDYRREASNAARFAALYSDRGGTAVDAFPGGRGVVVPEILAGLCTENVLVMEWIEGTKLTDVGAGAAAAGGDEEKFAREEREESLALLELAIQCTLSQLLDTGVMHADPHGGNLLKVPAKDDDDDGAKKVRRKKSRLAYLDFGLLSTVPAQVRDGLVCAVAVLIFSRDVDAVAGLFGELQLLPEEVLSDPAERAALREALTVTLDEALTFPEEGGGDGEDDDGRSPVPRLKFDKLLDALVRLVPRFRFELPPYFVNNARALSTLEGIAKSLDPDFNALRVMYPTALNRMLRNPTGSPVVRRTLAGLIRSDDEPGGATVDRRKVAKLLRDSAAITGSGRTRVLWDVIKTRGGQRFVLRTTAEELRHRLVRGWFRSSPRRGGGGGRRKRRRRRGILSGDYLKL